MQINVNIADDHNVVVNGLMHMLDASDHIRITNTYDCGKAVLEGLKKELPDVLLLDIQLPDINGDELAGIIAKKYPSVRILAMTAYNMAYYVKKMLSKGAYGYLLKNTDKATLVAAIESVYNKEQYIDEALKEILIESHFKHKKQNTGSTPFLSRREKDVLKLILEEHTSQEIADKLFLSLRTVEHYRTNLMQKLKVKNLIGLIKVAIQNDLIA